MPVTLQRTAGGAGQNLLHHGSRITGLLLLGETSGTIESILQPETTEPGPEGHYGARKDKDDTTLGQLSYRGCVSWAGCHQQPWWHQPQLHLSKSLDKGLAQLHWGLLG